MFPNMVCENYNGKKVNLPEETKGKYTLLGMAFSKDAETNLKTWINPMYNKFIGKKDSKNADPFDPSLSYDINLFFVPMFTGLNQMTSKQSKEKIKSMTDKELYDYLLFYEGDKTYKEELDFQKKDIPYFFVLRYLFYSELRKRYLFGIVFLILLSFTLSMVDNKVFFKDIRTFYIFLEYRPLMWTVMLVYLSLWLIKFSFKQKLIDKATFPKN